MSVSLATTSSSSFELPNFEWKVEVGDTMTYTFTKYFELGDLDGNGDLNSATAEIITADGKLVNITMTKGLKIKAEIMELGDYPKIQLSFNEIPTKVNTYTDMLSYDYLVRKTVTNRTYWESLATTETFISGNNTFINTEYVEGSYFVTKTNRTHIAGVTAITITKYNWKTGWFTYLHSKSTDTIGSLGTFLEVEITTNTPGLFGDIITGYEFAPVLILLTFLTIVRVRKRSR
jgi:hypothetical protein